MHPAALPPDELLAQCETTRTRRSGPGGQHRNKTETAVVLLHRATQTRAEAAERRSQAENLGVALRRLRLKLAIEHRTPPEQRAELPTPLWQGRLQAGKIVCSAQHEDYPALLAEAFDALDAAGYDLPAVAERRGCTASQLVKLIAAEPAAFLWLNRQRAERGLKPMK